MCTFPQLRTCILDFGVVITCLVPYLYTCTSRDGIRPLKYLQIYICIYIVKLNILSLLKSLGCLLLTLLSPPPHPLKLL